jgi:Acyl-CoA thioesterase C-terminal domain/Acyl-CoA thioesterase N-terminal domain
VLASFYERAGGDGETEMFVATGATAGPWYPDAQHGGPPSALAARALERHEPSDSMRLARVTVDILRPVPVGPLTLRTRTVRPGKRVALLETVMTAGDQEVLSARGWRIATLADGPLVAHEGNGAARATAVSTAPPPIPPDARPPEFPGGHLAGYLSQVEWRFVTGKFSEPGPCQVWARPLLPLLPDEDLSPMGRTLLLGDSGSGISMAVDPTAFIFINVDLTVILQRDPAGEWLLLDAVTTMGGSGTGLAETRFSDPAGVVGTGIQTLLVSPR